MDMETFINLTKEYSVTFLATKEKHIERWYELADLHWHEDAYENLRRDGDAYGIEEDGVIKL